MCVQLLSPKVYPSKCAPPPQHFPLSHILKCPKSNNLPNSCLCDFWLIKPRQFFLSPSLSLSLLQNPQFLPKLIHLSLNLGEKKSTFMTTDQRFKLSSSSSLPSLPRLFFSFSSFFFFLFFFFSFFFFFSISLFFRVRYQTLVRDLSRVLVKKKKTKSV